MDKKMKKQRWCDIAGIACGAILLILLIVNIISSNTVKTVGDTNISAEAVTLTGTATGRNGPVEVEVVADANRIYQIRVTGHEETEGIGSVAVESIPLAVYSNQSIEVDAVTGATITSDAVTNAVATAIQVVKSLG